MRLFRPLALGAAAFATACVVSESFDDGQFKCNPSGGADECPSDMKCGGDGLCRHFVARLDAGKDSSHDGNCFPATCATLAPKCGDLDDGCGNAITCGCTDPMSCGGGDILGQCGCHQQQKTSKLPTAAFEVNTGNVGWQNVNAVLASDDKYATTSSAVASGKLTNLLKVSAFDISLPKSAVVNGVEVDIERSATSSSSSLKDKEVRLLVGGNPLPTVAAKTASWGTSDSIASYGGDTDLWGATAISASQVEASDFGVSLSVTATASDTPRVDAISVTVFFTDPTCPTP